MPVLLDPPVDTSSINGLTRRNVTAGIAGLAAISGHRAMAQQASPATSGPRIVETIHGPVEIPATPQRIVAITYISSIAVAELGVIPVGVTRWLPELPPTLPDLSAVAIVENESYALDIEAIVALQPDLILGSDAFAAADQMVPYEYLSRIAPTALFAWTRGGANWTLEAAGCAEALGKTAEFDALRSTYDEKAAEIKTTYANMLSTLTVDFLDAGESAWYLHGPASTHCQVAADAGITLGAGATLTEAFTEYSFEQLNILAATGALIVRGAPDPSLAILNALPTFSALPAVSSGRVLSSEYFYVASYAQCHALLGDIEGGLKRLS